MNAAISSVWFRITWGALVHGSVPVAGEGNTMGREENQRSIEAVVSNGMEDSGVPAV